MRKKVTQRLVSGVLCLAMGITLISPVTSRAAETSEPTTQATTESASTETTTEVQAAPSEGVVIVIFWRDCLRKFQYILKVFVYVVIRNLRFMRRKHRKFRYLNVHIYRRRQTVCICLVVISREGDIHIKVNLMKH